ncbi:predicted protein [Nematostella vectensis]|uniref:Outer dense fiber protein 3-like protein 2 n=1 Tax=Nematostella vectensis TaxID=45351 RepID=A7SL55_NEMVE|nr:predicted protein [Nematostella vectensis]|eukprot:XP_001627655.1 predicted protein [Nematostella vectensis]
MPDARTGDQVKLPPIGAIFRGPGPGRYMLPTTCNYNMHDVTRNRRPAFSFGNKHMHALTNDCSPGPMYLPDSRITRVGAEGNPKYSLGGTDRYAKKTILRPPGPGRRLT